MKTYLQFILAEALVGVALFLPPQKEKKRKKEKVEVTGSGEKEYPHPSLFCLKTDTPLAPLVSH